MKRLSALLAISMMSIGILVGCSKAKLSAGAVAPPPPVPEVDVDTVKVEQIVDYRDYTGRTSAVDSVEVRPRVSGYLLQTPRSRDAKTAASSALSENVFHDVIRAKDSPDGKAVPFVVTAAEGETITAGQPLFEVDPEPYRLAFEQAAGNLEATKAQLTRAKSELERQKELMTKNATSKTDFDLAIANVGEAVGQIANLQAVKERAYLDWQYTQIRSPIAGLVGRSQMTRGNLAIADTTVLTTVVTTNPIYVYFNVDENSALDYRSRVQKGQVESARVKTIAVEMSLANENDFPHAGFIDFVDNRTDPESGNTAVRARFENPNGVITPGLFARVRAPFTSRYEAMLVPTVALASDQQGRYVMVVDDQNQVHRQAIKAGDNRGEQTVVREGLQAGMRVVVAGLQRIRDGAKVKVAVDAP